MSIESITAKEAARAGELLKSTSHAESMPSIVADLFAPPEAMAKTANAAARDLPKEPRVTGDVKAWSGFGKTQLPEAVISKGIPPFDADGFLPAGIHLSTWDELVERFAVNDLRRAKLPGMLHALHDLKENNVETAYGVGSFVTAKEEPNDFDISYLTAGRSEDILDALPILETRAYMNEAYGGELFPNKLEYFRNNDRDGVKKVDIGVVQIDLQSLPPRPEPVSPAFAVMDKYGGPDSLRPVSNDTLAKMIAQVHADFWSKL